ncbi:TnsA-like heteromeric transposase endonuclease subunit [Nonomuraea sp. NPDC046802]|uniref:TnsA-like heteromeric transposase endonuclease subunit n=1 Tax=Nonomuraea sp. NPDC046802 TaxID=3154919 RepID=UPI0033C548B5
MTCWASRHSSVRGGQILLFLSPKADLRITFRDLSITYKSRGVAVEITHRCELRSDRCEWQELLVPGGWGSGRESLELAQGWARKWTARWRYGGETVICSVRDLASMPLQGAEPVRRFSWRTSQFHRPGLQYMVSTGRHHGFESHAEQQLLLALDFVRVSEVLSQPFRLSFTSINGPGGHTPDFLAMTASGVWLIDVRPGDRIKDEDRMRFAAAAEAALSCGWRYVVAAGWRPHVQTTLDTVSAQRRPLADPLGLQSVLLAAAGVGPMRFGDLVGQVPVPAVARAQALHLIWNRRLAIDLTAPLNDQSMVHAGRSGR